MSGSREVQDGLEEGPGRPELQLRLRLLLLPPGPCPSLPLSLLVPSQFPHPLNESRERRLAEFRAGSLGGWYRVGNGKPCHLLTCCAPSTGRDGAAPPSPWRVMRSMLWSPASLGGGEQGLAANNGVGREHSFSWRGRSRGLPTPDFMDRRHWWCPLPLLLVEKG